MICEIRIMAIALNEDGKALRFYRLLHTLLSIEPPLTPPAPSA